jgi:hypothetical protein
MAKYEGKDVSGGIQPYSALGTSAPLNELNTGDVLAESAPAEEGNSSRKESYAMNALLSASNALQQQQPAPMLPIPRLSFAEGGIASVATNPHADRPVMFGSIVPYAEDPAVAPSPDTFLGYGSVVPHTGTPTVAPSLDTLLGYGSVVPNMGKTYTEAPNSAVAPAQPTTVAAPQPTTVVPPAYIQSPITFPTTATPTDFSKYSINPTAALNMRREDKSPTFSVQDLYPFLNFDA